MDTQERIKQIICSGQQIKTIINSGGGVIWSKEPDLPGPKKLIGGNADAGFYGEVPASEFITGDALANLIGLTDGVSQHSNEPWLKFSYLGNVEFITKKTIRFRIHKESLEEINAVYGNRTIKIREHTYKIRLIKGKTEGKQDDTRNKDGLICHNSEWNRLILPTHVNAPSNWKYPDNVKSPTENWSIGYSNEDLSIAYAATICQEKHYSGSIVRGFNDISYSGGLNPGTRYESNCWRPVLEFVK